MREEFLIDWSIVVVFIIVLRLEARFANLVYSWNWTRALIVKLSAAVFDDFFARCAVPGS